MASKSHNSSYFSCVLCITNLIHNPSKGQAELQLLIVSLHTCVFCWSLICFDFLMYFFGGASCRHRTTPVVHASASPCLSPWALYRLITSLHQISIYRWAPQGQYPPVTDHIGGWSPPSSRRTWWSSALYDREERATCHQNGLGQIKIRHMYLSKYQDWGKFIERQTL